MSEFVFKLPDLGEGTVEAEIVEWHVSPGDVVKEGDIIADVMTDKANVEVPAPVSGQVLRTSGEPGEMVAVGAELAAFQTEGAATTQPTPPKPPAEPEKPEPIEAAPVEPEPVQPAKAEKQAPPPAPPAADEPPAANKAQNGKVLASPALRRQANELGIDLANVRGTGPRGRILRRDFEYFLAQRPDAPEMPAEVSAPEQEIEEIKVIGVRRVIAQRMQAAKQEIPHFSYVEEVDVTALESLRRSLNARRDDNFTYLPFIGLAMIAALRTYPQCNQRYDAERNTLLRYKAVHLGIATQTNDGLKVPVVANADGLSLYALAAAISEVTEAARNGSATAADLTGSTITLTSLGKLGGIASTPVINAPEMGIIGVNKAVHRPMIVDGAVQSRLMMNLSTSFDHRFVDGFDAASLVQEIKQRLEEPALIFID